MSKRYFVIHCLCVQFTCLCLLSIMQIKLCCKMAKNDGSIVVHANTIQENERILHESCKHQVETKSKEDFEKLFIKLNYICQVRSAKEEVQLNPSWCNKNVINYTYGPISGFLSGSWWGIRMDCSRDRVHDPFNENIQNGPFGVTSICTSSTNLNEDVDFGNSLTLTGQKYLDGKSEKDPLIKNYESQIPLRLIRSYNLLNEFAPKTGYRYDGLYIVTNFWIGVNSDSTKYYKFSLSRLNDQEPAVWGTKQSSLNASRTSSTLHPTSTSLRNCSENLGSGITVQKVKHDKSNGFLQLSNFENKQTDEKEKGTPESAIVTRHVFKKANTECTPSMLSMSITSENKSLAHIGTQGSKAHNTNISIRTGLYDSSHSTQHDVKKSTLLPFCRTTKSLNLVKTNQHTEHLNSLNKDKNRSLDGKTQVITTNECPKRVDYISPNTIKSDTLKVKSTKDTSTEVNDTIDDLNCSKTHKNITNDSKDICKINLNSSDTPTNVLNSTKSTYRNENTTHTVVSKETQELKSLDSLDALTPDTILHLITKKCHPLSKLLMGNMIGLTSEQPIELKPHDLLTVQSEINNKVVTQRNDSEEAIEKKNFESIPDDLIGARCYKFRRRRKLSRKAMNKSEIRKCDKTHNGELQKGSVQSLDILGQNLMTLSTCNGSQENIPEEDALHSSKRNKDIKSKVVKQNGVQTKKIDCLQQSSKNIKKDVGSRNEIRTRLRTMKAIKSSLKKHINKKQRREIANLLIDANIGPKVRGPRNRRLRCISNTYAKQSYQRCSSAMCTVNKCPINSKILGQQSTFETRNKLAKSNNYKRIRDKQTRDVQRSKTLNLNETRIHKNLTVSKRVDKDGIAGRISNNNDNINSTNDNNKSVKFNLKSVQSNDATMVENRKRKLMQTVPMKVKCSPRVEELHKLYEKEISKPCKTDAVIQCSLIREPLMRSLKSNDFVQNNARNEQYTFIKIEYGEFKDTKSEISRATRSNGESKGHQTHELDGKCTKTACNIQHRKNSDISLNSNTLSTKEQSKSSAARMSAFVPVNILDSDLKIARLRSIGFKPIVTCDNSNETAIYQNKGNCSATFNGKVLKQNVSEKYNQYTNEENDVVVYMDDELQYQDIEDEDNNSLTTKRKTPESGVCVSSNEQINRITSERDSYNDPLWEQDLETPWHGWKKVVTSEDTYWIGW